MQNECNEIYGAAMEDLFVCPRRSGSEKQSNLKNILANWIRSTTE